MIDLFEKYGELLPRSLSNLYAKFGINFLEFEFVSEDFLKDTSYNLSNVEEDLILLFKDSVDSVYSIWAHGDLKLDEAPIVVIHSEGTPVSVISNSFSEFLSILYLGSYPNAKLGQHFRYLRFQSLLKLEPVEEFTDEEIKEIQVELDGEFTDYSDFLAFIKSQKIKLESEILKTMLSAIDQHPIFEPLIT